MHDSRQDVLFTTNDVHCCAIALSEPLRKGQYIVREHGETAGYVFEEIELAATVKPDGITELTAANQPVQVQLKLSKWFTPKKSVMN